MKSITEPSRFYRWIGVSMMAVGAALLLISVSGVLNPRAMCQDDIVVGREDVLALSSAAPCEPPIDPGFYLPSADGFIIIVLSLCLMAFGGAIFGMIIRLAK